MDSDVKISKHYVQMSRYTNELVIKQTCKARSECCGEGLVGLRNQTCKATVVATNVGILLRYETLKQCLDSKAHI